MTDDPFTLVQRFLTPDPRLAPREQAPMRAEELAWARHHAFTQRFSWIEVLVPPLCFGFVLPGIAWLIGLLLYRTLVAPELDIDRVIGQSWRELALATVLFFAAWVGLNVWRARRDPTKRYWAAMPGQGLVDVEHHTLITGINLWGNDYDPDCNTLLQWNGETLEPVQDSGVTQWLLVQTATGQWLALKQDFPGHFSYGREGQIPAPERWLQPSQTLTLAFAPGTGLLLGQRFSGAAIAMRDSRYWLSAAELKHLREIAHHWQFSPPDRYAVINPADVDWLQRLVDNAVIKGRQEQAPDSR